MIERLRQDYFYVQHKGLNIENNEEVFGTKCETSRYRNATPTPKGRNVENRSYQTHSCCTCFSASFAKSSPRFFRNTAKESVMMIDEMTEFPDVPRRILLA